MPKTIKHVLPSAPSLFSEPKTCTPAPFSQTLKLHTHSGSFAPPSLTPKLRAQDLKRVLPLPPSLTAQNCLGVRILELSSAQNTKTCTFACPPPSPKLPGSTHFGTFKRPKLKRVLPPAPPSQSPSCLADAFCDFQGPKTLKRALPPKLPGCTHLYMLLVFFCKSSLFCSHIQMLSGSQQILVTVRKNLS